MGVFVFGKIILNEINRGLQQHGKQLKGIDLVLAVLMPWLTGSS
jgi:hypothetical protein